jgi:peptidoglycan-N-acetylglucosamine deacetylase
MIKLFICIVFAGISAGAGLPAQASITQEILIDPSQPPLPSDGNLKDGQFALTFDDGPDPLNTMRILKTLKKYDIKATFFEVGTFAALYPEVTKEILKQGHSLGSHSWDHSDLATLSLKEGTENILQGHTAVERAAGNGFHTPFFRFPFFSSTPELDSALMAQGLTAFSANTVPGDWMTPDPKKLLANSLAALDAQKHGIFLLHDVHPQTAEMLDAFLEQFVAKGYRTVVFREVTQVRTIGP